MTKKRKKITIIFFCIYFCIAIIVSSILAVTSYNSVGFSKISDEDKTFYENITDKLWFEGLNQISYEELYFKNSSQANSNLLNEVISKGIYTSGNIHSNFSIKINEKNIDYSNNEFIITIDEVTETNVPYYLIISYDEDGCTVTDNYDLASHVIKKHSTQVVFGVSFCFFILFAIILFVALILPYI